VTLLGVLSFFLGFAPYAKVSSTGSLSTDSSFNFFDNSSGGPGVAGLAVLLATAFVAGFGLLPRQPANESIVAGLSLAGS
jgi:hypothetical protein